MSDCRFLADEDLRYEIVLATRRLDPKIEFETVVGLGLSSISDEDLLEFAQVRGWLLVSHDVNSLKGKAEDRIRNALGIPGLLLVHQRRETRAIAESLHLIWRASVPEEWSDRITYLPL